jgi:AhpD family alkylhydroperoxidase
MTQRLNYAQQSSELFVKFMEFVNLTKESAIEESIRNLVNIRTSQMNGCTFCLDMYVKQAKIAGERELRLYHLAAWRDSTLYVPRERAALAWTEILTHIPEQGVPEELYERVRGQLTEKEISDLTFLVMSANSWSRINLASKSVPGSLDNKIGLDKSGLH